MRQTVIRLLLVVLFFLLLEYVVKRQSMDSLLLAYVLAWILEGAVGALLTKGGV